MTLEVEYLGWVDLVFGSSPGWWATIVVIYCPSRVVEHAKMNSTKPRYSTTRVTLYNVVPFQLLLIEARIPTSSDNV